MTLFSIKHIEITLAFILSNNDCIAFSYTPKAKTKTQAQI